MLYGSFTIDIYSANLNRDLIRHPRLHANLNRDLIRHPRLHINIPEITNSRRGEGAVHVSVVRYRLRRCAGLLAKMPRSLCPPLALLLLLAGVSTTRKWGRACNYSIKDVLLSIGQPCMHSCIHAASNYDGPGMVVMTRRCFDYARTRTRGKAGARAGLRPGLSQASPSTCNALSCAHACSAFPLIG